MDCKAVVGDVSKLIVAVKTMSNPMSFVYHVGKDIVVNGV